MPAWREGDHTTHFTVLYAEGNAVAYQGTVAPAGQPVASRVYSVEELEGFICLVDALHGEEMGEARAGVPAVHAADEEFLGRMGGRVHHEVDELMECILCHENSS